MLGSAFGDSWNRYRSTGKAGGLRPPGGSGISFCRPVSPSRNRRIRQKTALGFNLSFSLFVNRPETPCELDSTPGIGVGKSRRTDRSFFMRQLVSRFLSDQSGATAIEYCLIAAGLSIVIVTAVNSIGSTLNTKFVSINSSLK
jgi:pilus assembly protein Flp/PilA